MKNTKGKIVIVVAVLLAIAGIWAAKNIDFSEETEVAATEAIPVTEAVTEEVSEAVTEAVTEILAASEDAEAQTEVQTEAGETEVAVGINTELESETFDFAELVSYGKPMVLDFGADACVPCQQMAPDLEAFHEENLDKATVKFYDVWKNPELASGYPIQVVPTQLFFMPDGSPYMPSDEIKNSDIRLTGYTSSATGEYGLTAHIGMITKEQLEAILADMEAQVE